MESLALGSYALAKNILEKESREPVESRLERLDQAIETNKVFDVRILINHPESPRRVVSVGFGILGKDDQIDYIFASQQDVGAHFAKHDLKEVVGEKSSPQEWQKALSGIGLGEAYIESIPVTVRMKGRHDLDRHTANPFRAKKDFEAKILPNLNEGPKGTRVFWRKDKQSIELNGSNGTQTLPIKEVFNALGIPENRLEELNTLKLARLLRRCSHQDKPLNLILINTRGEIINPFIRRSSPQRIEKKAPQTLTESSWNQAWEERWSDGSQGDFVWDETVDDEIERAANEREAFELEQEIEAYDEDQNRYDRDDPPKFLGPNTHTGALEFDDGSLAGYDKRSPAELRKIQQKIDHTTKKTAPQEFRGLEKPNVDFIWKWLKGKNRYPTDQVTINSQGQYDRLLSDLRQSLWFNNNNNPTEERSHKPVIKIEANKKFQLSKDQAEQLEVLVLAGATLPKPMISRQEVTTIIKQAKELKLNPNEVSFLHDLQDRLLRKEQNRTEDTKIDSEMAKEFTALFEMSKLKGPKARVLTYLLPLKSKLDMAVSDSNGVFKPSDLKKIDLFFESAKSQCLNPAELGWLKVLSFQIKNRLLPKNTALMTADEAINSLKNTFYRHKQISGSYELKNDKNFAREKEQKKSEQRGKKAYIGKSVPGWMKYRAVPKDSSRSSRQRATSSLDAASQNSFETLNQPPRPKKNWASKTIESSREKLLIWPEKSPAPRWWQMVAETEKIAYSALKEMGIPPLSWQGSGNEPWWFREAPEWRRAVLNILSQKTIVDNEILEDYEEITRIVAKFISQHSRKTQETSSPDQAYPAKQFSADRDQKFFPSQQKGKTARAFRF